MKKKNPTPGKYTRPEDTQLPAEDRKNPIAALLAKISIVAKHELPVVLSGLFAMTCVIFLNWIEYISVEFTLILGLSTIMLTAFRAGMVWQWLRSK